MSKFKVGDRVRWLVKEREEGYFNKGWFPYLHLGKVIKYEQGRPYVRMDYFENHKKDGDSEPLDSLVEESEIELVEETLTNKIKTINMSLINTFKKLTRSEPEKTFVKAGVLNEELTLTEDGKELFLNYMFEKEKVEFKKEVVDAIVKENESK